MSIPIGKIHRGISAKAGTVGSLQKFVRRVAMITGLVLSPVSFTAPGALSLAHLTLSGCYLPPDGWTRYELAQQLEKNGYYQEAIKEYRAFISAEPTSSFAPKAQSRIAEIYDYKLRDYPNAIAEYRILIKKYPHDSYAPEAQYRITQIYDQYLKDYKSALVEYKIFVKNYPGNSSASYAQSRIAEIYDYKLHDYPSAITEYRIFIKNNPDDSYAPHVQYRIAEIYDYELKDCKNAVVEYKLLIKNYPSSDFFTSKAKASLEELSKMEYC
jgi:TolA-binding protein